MCQGKYATLSVQCWFVGKQPFPAMKLVVRNITTYSEAVLLRGGDDPFHTARQHLLILDIDFFFLEVTFRSPQVQQSERLRSSRIA